MPNPISAAPSDADRQRVGATTAGRCPSAASGEQHERHAAGEEAIEQPARREAAGQARRRPSPTAPAAAPPALTPRSVSSADRCAIAPFCAIELQNSTTTRIQNARDGSPSRTEAPCGRRWRQARTPRGRSRTNSATVGRPTTSTITPSATNAVRQPATSISACGERRQHHRADRAAATAPPTAPCRGAVEPARDGARVGHLRGAVADDADDEEHGVEVPEVRRQQRQRRERAAEDRERTGG